MSGLLAGVAGADGAGGLLLLLELQLAASTRPTAASAAIATAP